jgi:hypothetical protein
MDATMTGAAAASAAQVLWNGSEAAQKSTYRPPWK